MSEVVSNRVTTPPNLTYVVLTYNRQDFARRQLLSLATSNLPINAIVADGSKSVWDSGDRGNIGSLNWTYFHLSGEFTYLERLKKAVRLVNTEFVCLVDDQDVYFPSVHQETIRIHNLEEGIYSCVASSVGRLFKSQSYFSLSDWGHWSQDFSFNSENPCRRAAEVIENRRTANFYYQPIKTEQLKEFLDILEPVIGKEREFVWGFIENALAIYLAGKGQLKIISSIGWLRVDSFHEEKSNEFVERKKIATSSDIDLLMTFISGHQKSLTARSANESICRLQVILETWIGFLEVKTKDFIPSDSKAFQLSKSEKLRRVSVRFLNKLILILDPLTGTYIREYLKDAARIAGGVKLRPTQDILRSRASQVDSFDILQILGVHELFPRGVSASNFNRYSK